MAQQSALIAFGSNLPFGGLGGPDLLRKAAEALAAAGLPVLRRSGFWRTRPWPDGDQPWFTNAVVQIGRDGQDAQGVYQRLAAVEAAFGRTRSNERRYAPRPLDLDLIDMDGEVQVALDTEGLTLPHPRCHERAFVLAPLREVAPGWRQPVLGKDVSALLSAAKDRADVRRLCDWDKDV